jgi:hypothetical protein
MKAVDLKIDSNFKFSKLHFDEKKTEPAKI